MSCSFAAGMMGGVLSTLFSHPFDTAKTYQQTQPKLGMIACVRNIVQIRGFKGLYRGVSLPLGSSGVMNGMFFGSYEITARYFEKIFYKERLEMELKLAESENRPPISRLNYSPLSIFIGGTIAGTSQILVGCPVELLKIKLQTGDYRKPSRIIQSIGSFSLAKLLFQKYGIRALYQGSGIMLLREIPSSIIYMFMYQELSVWLKKCCKLYNMTKKKYDKIFVPFIAGGTAGIISSWSAIPFDVVKSRIQATSFKKTSVSSLRYHFVALYKEQGLMGFTRGILPITLRAFPVNGIAFAAYESFMFLCTTHREKQQSSKP